MDHSHHKSIKRFSLDGIIKDDVSIGRLRVEYIKLLKAEMRLNGYAPRLDIDPNFTIYYNHDKDYYEFILSVYGTYIGRKKTECIEGIDGTMLVPTPKNKSNESLQDQESTSNQK
jgi:hypothetical protein